MRRDPTADNGLVELMVASLAERAAAFSVGRVSLNFAMFREAFERGAEIGAGPIARLWRQALLVASRNWQLESLYLLRIHLRPTAGGYCRRQRRRFPDAAGAGDIAPAR